MALAAALSTAAGLLLAISSAISHDLIKGSINPNISEKSELLWARIAMTGAIIVATYLGLNPPGFAAQTVALAFGLALSGIACVMLGLAANWFAGAFLAFTIFFYAVIYTMWLKRSTPQNIV